MTSFECFLHPSEINLRPSIFLLGLLILHIAEISCVQGWLFGISNSLNLTAHPQFYYLVLPQTKLSKLTVNLPELFSVEIYHNFLSLARLWKELSHNWVLALWRWVYYQCKVRWRWRNGGCWLGNEQDGDVGSSSPLKTSGSHYWELEQLPGLPSHEAFQFFSSQFFSWT